MNKDWIQELKKKKNQTSNLTAKKVKYLTDSLQDLQENTGQMCMNSVRYLSKEALHNPD